MAPLKSNKAAMSEIIKDIRAQINIPTPWNLTDRLGIN